MSVFTKLSIAFLLNCSDSPPSILRINAWTAQDLYSSETELIPDEDFKGTYNVINFGYFVWYTKLMTMKVPHLQRALLEKLISLLEAKNISKYKSYYGKMV